MRKGELRSPHPKGVLRMKKRIFVLAVLAVVVAGGVFAQPEFKLSAGIGGYFTSDFGGGAELSMGGLTGSNKAPYVGGGGFAFFDATYAELSLGFWVGGGKLTSESPGQPDSSLGMSYTGLDIGLLGKYPFVVSDQLSVFPLLGITYRVMLSVKDEDGREYKGLYKPGSSSDFSALWFKLGGGLDFSLTDSMYLRGSVLYGLRLPNAFEKDIVDFYKAMVPGADTKTLLGHGLEVKLAIGYRF
jgi:opacity protein-like surface antigen